MAFSWAPIVTFFTEHPLLSEIALSAGGELFSSWFSAGMEQKIDTTNDKSNIVEQYLALQATHKKLKALIESDFITYMELPDETTASLNYLTSKFGLNGRTVDDFWVLWDEARAWLEKPSNQSISDYSSVEKAYHDINSIYGEDDYRRYFEEKENPFQTQQDLASISEQLRRFEEQYPILMQAAKEISADSQNPLLEAVFGAIETVLERMETATNDIVTTEQSLSEKINIMTGNNAMLLVHEGLLGAAIQNIPTTIATMAPVYPVCSCGGAMQPTATNPETVVDDFITGVRQAINGMEVNLDGQKIGSYVNRHIAREVSGKMLGYTSIR